LCSNVSHSHRDSDLPTPIATHNPCYKPLEAEMIKFSNKHSVRHQRFGVLSACLCLLGMAVSISTAIARLSITSNTTQNGGVLQVPNAPNTLTIGHVSDPQLTLTNGANGNQVQRVFVGSENGHSGRLLLQNNSVMELTALNVARIAIGEQAGSTGVVRVQTNSLLSVTGGIRVGELGNGTLIVEQGGRVRNHGMTIGDLDFATGTVLVTGQDSRIDIEIPNFVPVGFSVGSQGNSGTMIVLDGGVVAATGSGQVGFGTVGLFSLFDPGSAVMLGEQFVVGVGQNGQGTATIAGGATLTSHGSRVGAVSSSDGPCTTGSVTVTGANSLWTNHANLINWDTLIVGHTSSGTLVVSGGGTLSAAGTNAVFPRGADMALGNYASANATVTGANSTNRRIGELIE